MHKPHGVGRKLGQGGSLAHRNAQRSNEPGQAMVEFALTITITLLLIFGMIDFSRAIYTASVIQWAAQQGARTGIANPPPTNLEIETVVKARLAGLDPDAAVVTPTRSDNLVTVTVTYEYDFMIPMISRITGESILLSATASMVAQ